jgi:hypothetical protein
LFGHSWPGSRQSCVINPVDCISNGSGHNCTGQGSFALLILHLLTFKMPIFLAKKNIKRLIIENQ